jgi:hypothetical protein
MSADVELTIEERVAAGAAWLDEHHDFEYAELTAEWRRLIESRRVAS